MRKTAVILLVVLLVATTSTLFADDAPLVDPWGRDTYDHVPALGPPTCHS